MCTPSPSTSRRIKNVQKAKSVRNTCKSACALMHGLRCLSAYWKNWTVDCVRRPRCVDSDRRGQRVDRCARASSLSRQRCRTRTMLGAHSRHRTLGRQTGERREKVNIRAIKLLKRNDQVKNVRLLFGFRSAQTHTIFSIFSPSFRFPPAATAARSGARPSCSATHAYTT